MARLMGIMVWVALTAGILYVGFGPDQPLVQQGPWAAIGLGLLGVAICQHFNSPETEA